MAAHILSATTTVAKTTPNNVFKAPKTPFLSKPPLVSFNKLPLLTPKPFMTFNKPFMNFNKSFIPKAVVSQNNADNNDKDSVAEVEDGSGQEGKSRVLIIGATGNLGYHLAKASIKHDHPTFALIRKTPVSDPIREMKCKSLSDTGVTILEGSLEDEDEESLLKALKQVEVVICAIPSKYACEQEKLIRAIKHADCIKADAVVVLVGPVTHQGPPRIFGIFYNRRFIPSEFGADPTKVHETTKKMDKGFYSKKEKIREQVKEEEIPYTFISCNFLMSCFLPTLVQPELELPPRDKVTIYGDGNAKGVFVNEVDVADFTIRAVDDPRTLNKVMYLRPAGNVYSMNELVDDWEKKIGKKLERDYKTVEELLTKIKECPDDMAYVFIYSAFVKEDQTRFAIESSSGGVDGTKLYPEVKYTTISQYLDTLVWLLVIRKVISERDWGFLWSKIL